MIDKYDDDDDDNAIKDNDDVILKFHFHRTFFELCLSEFLLFPQ